MNFNINDLISLTEASNRGISRLIRDAANGRTQIVLRNNKAVAAVVGIEAIERLQRLEELESDLRLLSAALARTAAGSGRGFPLDGIATDLGIDLDSLADLADLADLDDLDSLDELSPDDPNSLGKMDKNDEDDRGAGT